MNEPDVMRFFERNPFAGAPPRLIRALVYDYHFTDEAKRRATGDWWWRDNERVWLPPVALKDGSVQDQSGLDGGM